MGAAREISRRWLYAVLVVASGLVITFCSLTFYGGTGALVVAVSMLGCAAIAWACWALFIRDRSRGRRRCPKCWYDMSGTDGLRCPECGRTAKREKSLHRTHRHWRLAVLALLPALMSVYLALLPKIREHGWQSVVPTTALIWCMELEDNEWVFEELGRRALRVEDKFIAFYAPREGALYDWQWRQIGRKSIELIESDLPAGHRYGLFDWITRTKWALHGDSFVEEVDAALVRLLDDPDPKIRQSCAIYIADINNPDSSIEFLRSLLHDEDANVRRGATTGLRLLVESNDEAVSLVATAPDDPSKDVRLGALGALGVVAQSRVLSDDVIQHVRQLAHDPDRSVREYQVITIVRMLDSNEVGHEIRSAIRSEDDARRSGAYSVLAYYEHSMTMNFLPELVAGLSESTDEARTSAAIALSSAEPAALEPYEEEIKAAIEPERYPNSMATIRQLLVDIHHLRVQREMDALENESVTE